MSHSNMPCIFLKLELHDLIRQCEKLDGNVPNIHPDDFRLAMKQLDRVSFAIDLPFDAMCNKIPRAGRKWK